MGLTRPAKGQKSRAPLGFSRLNVPEKQMPKDATTEDFPLLTPVKAPKKRPIGAVPKLKTPEIPKLKLPQPSAADDHEEPPLQRDEDKLTARGRAALAVFEDFWDDNDDAPAVDDDAIKISTPRKGEAPLKIFKVGTPPSSPRQRPLEKRGYVPQWPYGSQWPFNCAPTTLELRGLPRGCTAEIVISQLNAWGFAGKFDLVYVPTRGAGFAVVNSARHADGCALAGKLHGFSDWTCTSRNSKFKKKPCRVEWSFTCQGLDALVLEYHRDSEAWGYDDEGRYTGPWVHHFGIWVPLFSPVHLWPVAVPVPLDATAPEWDMTDMWMSPSTDGAVF